MVWLTACSAMAAGLMLVTAAGSAQESPAAAPYLGGHAPQAVIGHFGSLEHPYLMVTDTNREEIDRKASSDDPVLKLLWGNLTRASVQHHMDGTAFRVAYTGREDPGAQELADAVRQWRFRYKDGQKWWDDYLTAADMMRHLYAFDAARGVGLLSAEDEEAFAAQVEGLIEGKSFKKRLVHPAQGQELSANWSGNINESVAIAQCLAALTLPHHPRALQWFGDGSQYLQMCFDQQANGANLACQAEGQTYQVGFSHQVLALLAVPLEEHGFGVVRRDDNFIEECFDWAVSSLRPDLIYPTTEDAWPNNTLGGIWPARYAGPETRNALLWHYRRLQASSLGKKDAGRGFGAAANMMAYEPREVPDDIRRPRVRSSELASVAVFGTDWTADSSWLYFLGDRTPWRYSYRNYRHCANNKPHAHGDQTSFSLYALGRYLATETTRFSGTVAKDHNLILVDGKEDEPSAHRPEQFTELSGAFDTEGFAGATMKCAYAGVDLHRSILMVKRSGDEPETEYYVVFDDLAADGKHTYDWLLHNREDGAAIEAQTGAAHVRAGDAVLDVIFAGVEPDGIDVKQAELPQYKEVFLDARASREGDVRWLTVLYPRKVDAPEPEIERIGTDTVRLRIGGVEDVVLTNAPGREAKVGTISTDAAGLFLRRERGDTVRLCLRDGRRVTLTGKGEAVVMLESGAPVTASLQYTQDRVEGLILADGESTVTVRWPWTGKGARTTVLAGTNRIELVPDK